MQYDRMFTKVVSFKLLFSFLFLLQSPVAVAQIVTDGSVGTAGNLGVSQTLTDGLAADHVVIGEELGTLVGKNLFHSFNEFNIQTNGSATFNCRHHAACEYWKRDQSGDRRQFIEYRRGTALND